MTSFFNAFAIAIDENTKAKVKVSDLVIEPCLSGFRRMGVKQIDELIAEGHRAALEVIPNIRKVVEHPLEEALTRSRRAPDSHKV